MALASLSYGTTTDATFTQSTNNGQAGYSGFTFNLSDDWLSLAPSNLDLTDYTDFNLTSVALVSAATWYNLANNASGLVILDSTNTVVGKSGWNNTGSTYTFDSLTLSVNQDYTAVFYGNKTAYDNLDTTSSITSFVGSQNPTEAAPIVAAGLRLNYNTSYTDGVMINNAGSAATNAFPVVTFSGQLVPEPTTATLSLLALAGLAARRRRK